MTDLDKQCITDTSVEIYDLKHDSPRPVREQYKTDRELIDRQFQVT